MGKMSRALMMVNPGWRATVATKLPNTTMGQLATNTISSSTMQTCQLQILAEQLNNNLVRSRGLVTSAARLSGDIDQLLPNIQVTMPLEVMVMEDPVDMDTAVLTMKRDQLLPNIQVTMPLEVMVMEDQVDMDMAVLTMKRDQLLLNIQVTMLLEVMVMEDQVDLDMAVLTMKREQLLPNIQVTMLLEAMVMEDQVDMDMEA